MLFRSFHCKPLLASIGAGQRNLGRVRRGTDCQGVVVVHLRGAVASGQQFEQGQGFAGELFAGLSQHFTQAPVAAHDLATGDQRKAHRSRFEITATVAGSDCSQCTREAGETTG